MNLIVQGFKIGWKGGSPHPATERFLTSEHAEWSIEGRSEEENVPVAYYEILPCWLLEVQAERGDPMYFDLGNPIELVR